MSDPAAAATWDAAARRYGRQERHERRAVDAALRLADLRADDRLLDLGTGTGLLLRAAAALPVPPGAAFGVDRSAAMLDRVGDLPAGWATVEADARAVPLPDACADVVTIAYVLHLLNPGDRAAVLAEARRLLRPGAGTRVVVVTVRPDRSRVAGRLAHRAFGALAAARPATLGGLAPLDPTADLRRAGLVPERGVSLPAGGYPALVVRARPA